MITEWSGAALDYAFSRLRPVISIDTPPKINNPSFAEVEYAPFEDGVRTQIGRVVALSDVGQVGPIVREVVADSDQWSERIRAVRDSAVFNLGRSTTVGAGHLLDTYRRVAVPPRR